VDDSAVLAHRIDWNGKGLVLLHNLGGTMATVGIKRRDLAGRSLVDWFGNRDYGSGVHNGRP
jgi:hypothetical protein